jgi:hypothetical protein
MNYPQLASPELWVSTSLSSSLAKLPVDFERLKCVYQNEELINYAYMLHGKIKL